jgi:hypothetical protein
MRPESPISRSDPRTHQPLPPGQFCAFREFIKTTQPKDGFPVDPAAQLRWEQAAAIAASVVHALGRFGIVSTSAAEIEDEALAEWMALGTDEWRSKSRQAILIAERPPSEQPAAFAFDSPAFGLDRGTWALTNGELVRQLNACRPCENPM